ncbi:hypothetical protein DRB96_38800 [Streptomyces sp. ICC1]|nr:hypothetical protein DRB96_38800 [Streptomyces sp. ICC1]
MSGLISSHAVFLPAEPPRAGRIAFWQPDPDADADADADADLQGLRHELQGLTGPGTLQELTVVAADLRTVTVSALVLPVADAVALLTRVRAAASAGAAPFWGAAALLALRLAARGLLLPGVSPAGYDAWRLGPLEAADLAEVRELAAAMPPAAHCVPLGPGLDPDGDGPARLPAPEPLLRAFLDAVADTLPRSPAAPAAAGGPAYAAVEPGLHPELREWAAEVAAEHEAGVRVSLRIDLDTSCEPPAFRAVLQMHGLADAALVADAADVWAGAGAAAAGFPPRARLDALRALRRAARLWRPLAPLLGAAVPDSVDLADEEVAELLGEAGRALAADGVQVHWPRGLARTLTARAVVGRPAPASAAASGDLPGLLSPTAAPPLTRRHAPGRQGDLPAGPPDLLPEARRPLAPLRPQSVLVASAHARPSPSPLRPGPRVPPPAAPAPLSTHGARPRRRRGCRRPGGHPHPGPGR